MNHEEYIVELLRIFENCNDIEFHQDAVTEMNQLIIGTGYESSFLKQFGKFIQMLSTYGFDAVKLKGFERLKDTNGLFSMRLCSSKYNIRILYSILSDGKILLHTFYEREGKSVSGYDKHIIIAEKRLSEMED
ncbi:hypothetical protein [Eubacterium limosum]|uniref:hypothetical protein n=1 Tax=Eubacterium limosum TaxID=1736 RepID=UPI001D08A060|nr:hypothetical protein [Eubacterium limosum]MCB6572245.1 hypothetical protein [Eubacterium limosum]